MQETATYKNTLGTILSHEHGYFILPGFIACLKMLCSALASRIHGSLFLINRQSILLQHIALQKKLILRLQGPPLYASLYIKSTFRILKSLA